MAYTVTAYGNQGSKSAQYREYEIDTPDDLDTLPVQAEITAIGSLAHSRSNNTTYKLGNNREWYALSESGGGTDNRFFIIPLTQTDTAYTTTVLCSEIAAALTAGKDIMFVIREETSGIITNALTMGGIAYDPHNAMQNGYISGQVIKLSGGNIRMVYITGSNMDEPPSFFYIG